MKNKIGTKLGLKKKNKDKDFHELVNFYCVMISYIGQSIDRRKNPDRRKCFIEMLCLGAKVLTPSDRPV